LDCRMILGKIGNFFTRKPLLGRSRPFMRLIRGPGAACNVDSRPRYWTSLVGKDKDTQILF
jgi:hypothetical protein